MIKIKHVSKVYGDLRAVDQVNLTIKKGEIFGIVGYSGAGKSTLLRCLNLLEEPTKGKIYVDGKDLTSLSNQEIRVERQNMGMIFQHFHLISAKTVYENIAFALKVAGKKKNEISERVAELLEMVGLEDWRDHYPAQLSGGQKQRVGIARALANEPKVLLCDEPTSALDPTTTESILDLLHEINQRLGITIVIITHEMEVVQKICDRLAVMENGRVIETGHVYDIFSNPKTELSKQFVQTVHSLELPERIMEIGTDVTWKITFRGKSAEEGIIAETIKKYSNVEMNILHGQITYIKDRPLGTFIVKVDGPPDEKQAAIEYLKKRTEKVEVFQNESRHDS